ncbi:MAG: type II toxin-antitoxin system VapC family toxin [Treponema sp.]|nr:type II toxin-antitoxin system VapC family toxin [Treponema sp.]
MKYLLDTHALLWFLFNNPNLSKNARDVITSKDKVYTSIVTVWEIAIKRSIKKLDIEYSSSGLKELCEKENIEILPLLEKHIDLIHEMPFFHNDPFDRMIIAQAQSENLSIITKDSKIKLYDVNVLW